MKLTSLLFLYTDKNVKKKNDQNTNDFNFNYSFSCYLQNYYFNYKCYLLTLVKHVFSSNFFSCNYYNMILLLLLEFLNSLIRSRYEYQALTKMSKLLSQINDSKCLQVHEACRPLSSNLVD